MLVNYLIQVRCLWGIITRKVFKVMVDILEEKVFGDDDVKMSEYQNDTHIHSVEDNHGHGKDSAHDPNDHNYLVSDFQIF